MTVTGHFERFDGTLESRGEHGLQAALTLDATGVDTGNAKRDKNLRSADFFDVDQHPTVEFVSTNASTFGDGRLRISGELTAARKTVPVEAGATLRASAGRIEIDGEAVVDRTRFDMTWSPLGMASSTARLHVKASLVPDRESEPPR
jgi:polyisoprenoid-binding protein YceI